MVSSTKMGLTLNPMSPTVGRKAMRSTTSPMPIFVESNDDGTQTGARENRERGRAGGKGLMRRAGWSFPLLSDERGCTNCSCKYVEKRASKKLQRTHSLTQIVLWNGCPFNPSYSPSVSIRLHHSLCSCVNQNNVLTR